MNDRRFVIYAQGHRAPDVHPRTHVVVFDEPEQAKTWLQRMEQNLPEGFTLRSDQMDAIRKAAETNWKLPDQYAQWILRFKYGTWDEVPVRDTPVASDDGEDENAPRVKHERRAHKPDGYVTITELCATSDVPACDARAALRASGRIKPDYGWAFDPKEVPAIKKLCGIKE